MSLWLLLAVVLVVLIAIGYLAVLGAKSPLRVLFIPPTAWSLALDCWRSSPRVLAAMSSLVVFSALLQLYFVNTSGHDPQMLLVTSIVWQALMAALTAALAVPLHLFVIHRYWQAVFEGPPDRGRLLDFMPLHAAAYGLAIWIFGYVVGVGTRILVESITDPSLQALAGWGLGLVVFLLTSLLVLVRPSLSLNMPHPLRTGIRLAARNALPLYLVLVVMALPASLLRPEADFVPRIFMRSVLPSGMVSIVLISALHVFQYLAVEISTVLFTLGALLRARDQARRRAAARIRAVNRPAPVAP